jgi:valyl-tRNA synthetase
MEMISKYGADATRMGLVASREITTDWMISRGQLEEKIRGCRNFANKIWNASRFVLAHEQSQRAGEQESKNKDDKWILEETAKTVAAVTEDLEKYRLGQAAEKLYDFFWHTFCDRYIEMTKNRRHEAQSTLIYVLETSLKLLHPFMPFITEEIWGKLPNQDKPLIISPWPKLKT